MRLSLRARRSGSLTMSTILVATLLQATVSSVVAEAENGPSVPLPPTSSVSVTPQTMAPRPPDQATNAALRGDQPASTPPDGGGSNTATSLAPSATWDVSEQTGDFSWSYPLRVPPAPGSLEPNLALSYRSSAVDGRTSATNNQASWVGDGWDLWPGFVERTYGGCADDTDGGTTPPRTGDLCWRSDNATAAFSGGGGMLIRDDATGVWRTKNDDGARIDRFTGTGNGDADGEHWRITTVDGTQYWFGSQPGSGATWTVPVFGDDTGEPCHGASFEASHCVQAWRWNLDKVIDRHGNVIRYFYDTEANSYGMNAKDAAASYIRGGTLNRIEYGLRDDLPGNPGTGRVLFTTADRCVKDSVCTLDRKPNWPDTPLDQRCDAATCKDRYSPTFWTTKRLTSVTTQVWRGSAYADVDRWTLGQEFPDPGDGEKAALWLRTVTHTGLVGGSLELPAVTFEGRKMANRVDRVDGVGPLNRYRVTAVISEAGGVTSVDYASPDCHSDTPPTHPESNMLRCYPARWAKKDHAERTDYFHKYVVARVVQSDRLSTSTQQVTSYEYLDGAAWHWDMSEFVKDDKKTWNEFRGFGRVRVRTGAANDPSGPITLTEHRFYRGMNADPLPSGTRPATVTDSEGGRYTDHDWLQGFELESTTFNGDGGPVVAKTLTEPTWQGPTATRGVFKAYIVRSGAQRTIAALESGGWRTTRTESSYDDRGLPTLVNDLADTTTAADDRCTRTTYVRNTDRWLLNLPVRTETVAVRCGETATFPEHAIADTRTSYDEQNAGAAPTVGNATRVEVAEERPAAGPVYVTIGTSKYDRHGRVTETTDALGNTTKSAFTPAISGPVTRTVVTTPPTMAVPAGMVTTTTLEPAFGQPTVVVDPNNRRTDIAYDALGRKTEIWLPNRPRSSHPQGTLRFNYQVHNDRPTVITSTTLGPNGNYTSTNELFDGFLRKRQVQAPAVGGGRLLADIRYDSHGRVFKSTQPYFNNADVDGTLWVASDVEVPGLTRTEFDGAGRVVAQIYFGGATEKWRTTTAYGGDRVHVTPPRGGTATTTVTDVRGRPTELRQYAAATPTGGYDVTQYAYTPAGELAHVTDPAGNTWRYDYNLRGRQIRTEDPDRGTSTMAYDNAGHLTSTTNAENVTLAYSYDSLGRKTGTFLDRVGGTKLAEWTYDTALSGKGQLAATTRHVNGHAYTTSVRSYTSLYLPTETTITIPAVEGQLAGSYTWFGSYGWDGSLSGESYPPTGGLPRETVKYVLDDWSRPLTTSGAYNGTVDLVTDTSYTRYGEPQRIQLGTGTARAWLSYYYDGHTRRLERSIVDAEVPRPMQTDTRYTYDPAGNLTAIADTPQDKPADVQCFRYDHLRRLTEAWTPATNCEASPTTNTLSGAAPYWHTYTYSKAGNRLSEIHHGSAGDTSRTYTYPADGQPQAHTLTSVTTNSLGGTSTDTFAYNKTGDTIQRVKAGVGETLVWDSEGHLASVTRNGKTTSFIYTADGQRLLRKDPTGTTLYLDKQEIRLATGTDTPASTRYYTHGGTPIAVRQGGAHTWLANDYQASPHVAINSQTLQVTHRRQLPFGAPRGTQPTEWPGEKGFVGGTTDATTGLTHLGAREYDPTLGRFLSVDPIMDLADPQQMHGYTYANNNPITFSDPTGLRPAGCEEFHMNCATDGPITSDNPVEQAAHDDSKNKAVKQAQTQAKLAKPAYRGGIKPPKWVLETFKANKYTGSDEFTWADAIEFAKSGPYGFDHYCQGVLQAPLAQCEQMRPDVYFDTGELLHATLDVLGFIPVAGEFADGLNALAYLAEGDVANAFASGVGLVPGIGDSAKIAGRTANGMCSFAGDTEVLMADGTHKPIEDVEVGDKVLAADPETGETGPRVVTAVWHHQDSVMDLAMADGAVVTTTEDHPYWNATDSAWEQADQLDPGDALLTADGSVVPIVGLDPMSERTATAHNLTVADIYTYFVMAGGRPILVHNCSGPVRLADDVLNTHILPLHGPGSPGTGSKFNDSVDLDDYENLANEVVRRAPVPARVDDVTGNHAHEFNVGRVIGENGETRVRVWVDTGGNLRTMHPF
jgi:RHS repeat-associated protein